MSDDKKPKRIRKMFFTGVLFIIPIGVSYWILSILVNKIESWARPFIGEFMRWVFPNQEPIVIGWLLTLISILFVFGVIVLVGALANFYIGKKVLLLVDTIMLKLPVVRGIYGGTKQIIEAFSIQQNARAFKTVVFFEYPRKGCWVLGFVTSDDVERIKRRFGTAYAAVFVPSTPNPTTGFLLYLDPHELWVLDMSVEEAVKLIVSAGIVIPPSDRQLPVSLADRLKDGSLHAKSELEGQANAVGSLDSD